MKRYIALSFFSLFINCYADAQNIIIDSLYKLIIRSTSDTQKLNLSNQLMYAVSEINIDSSSLLAKKNIEEAKKIGYKVGEADALRLLAANFARQGNYSLAEKNVKNSEAIIVALDDSLRLAKIYAVYGMIYGMQAKYDTCIRYYQRSIGIAERHGNDKDLGLYYGNIAIGYQMQSNFPQAITYQLKSLNIAEQHNDINLQAYTQMNLGNTYQDVGDTLRAEKAFLKGIALSKSVGIKNVELYGYSNIASLYTIQKKWEDSYRYAKQSAELAATMGDEGIRSASLSKAAVALANMHEYDDAENLSKKSIYIADSSKQPYSILQAYSSMGLILQIEDKYTEAIPFLEKSLQSLAKTDRYDETIQQIYEALSNSYEKAGNYNKALSNFKSASEISDSIRNKENIRKTTELTLKTEFEKKQSISDALQGEKNAEARLRQILLLSGFLITLLIAVGIWRNLKNNQKANTLLKEQKERVEVTLSELKATQAQLIQAEKMASLGELTAGIAHEIQNPLNFVKNFSEVSMELLDEMKEEMTSGSEENIISIGKDLKNNLEKITHHTMRADSIVKGMLQHSRTNTGQKELTNINKLTDEYLQLSYHGLRTKENSFNIRMETHYDLNVVSIKIVPQDLGRVLLNLFNNAFYAVIDKKKMTGENYDPFIIVSTKKINNLIAIRIKDNGNGIAQKVLDKIYQPFFTTKPTGQGTGLGLSLSYDIIKAHHGDIKVETQEGEGAEFIIELPVIL